MPEAGAKAALRQEMKALRDGLGAGFREEASRALCAHVAALCLERGFTRIAAFWPLGSEIDLRPLVEDHPAWTFLFPRIASRNPPGLAWGPPPLGPGPWGLLEPLEAPHAVPPVDLVLVPGLAFAEDGHRLGYGKGFYDSVLPALPREAWTLGVGFSVQRRPSLPSGPWDVPVKALGFETGITRI
jgi:5-formyltetrahydrofolate cyclo-ligase